MSVEQVGRSYGVARSSAAPYPELRMMLAQQRLADLLRDPARRRRRAAPNEAPLRRLGCSYRLPDGSWIHARRAS